MSEMRHGFAFGCPGSFPGRWLDFAALAAMRGGGRSVHHSIKQRHVVLPDLHAGGAAAENLARLPGSIPVTRSTFDDKRLQSRGARGEPPEEWCGGCSGLKRPVKRHRPEPAILSRTTTARDPPLRKGLRTNIHQ